MTPELKAAFDNPDGMTVTQYLDVWGDASYEAEIVTEQNWHGDNDAAAGSVWTQTVVSGFTIWTRTSLDVNCSTTDNKGSIQLSSGSTVAPFVPTTFIDLAAHRYTFTVDDQFHLRYGLFYTHDSTKYTVVNDLNQRTLSAFIPKANMLVNAIELQVYIASSIVFRDTYPPSTFGGSFLVSILDSEYNIVGNPVSAAQTYGTTTNHHFTGLNATVKEGLTYYIELYAFRPPLSAFTYFPRNVYTVDIQAIFRVGNLGGTVTWQAETSTGYGFNLGGKEGYQATGSFERSFDMGGNPTDDGIFLVTDLTPSDSSYVVTLYHTNDPLLYAAAGVVGWTSYGTVIDGDEITQPVSNPRYWRAHVDFTASTGNDETPNISRMAIRFSDRPTVFGTYHEAPDDGDSAANIGSVTALDSVTSTGSEMNPILSKSIDGITKCVLMADDATHALINTPKGRRCRYRRGFLGIAETVTVNEGELEEVQWNGLTYTLTFKDSLGISDDAKMPRDKADVVWSGAATYALDDYVTYNRKKYKSLVDPNTGNQPDISPAQWQDEGTVWIHINYLANTHLVDIAIDILTNQLNISSSRVDFQSFEQVRALYPNRKITKAKTIDTPISIKDSCQEIAWLLESQWVKLGGKIALIPEPVADAAPEFVIREQDIDISTFKFKRGRSNLKNTCILQTDYEDGVAYDGRVSIDAASVTANDGNYYIFSFIDKWNMDIDECAIRASNYTTRNADGRRIIEFTGALRLEQIQVGTPVSFEASTLLPAFDSQTLNMFVLSNNRDDSQIKTNIVLMEI